MDLHHKCKGEHGNDNPVFSWMKHLRQNMTNPRKGESRNLFGEMLQVKHRIVSHFEEIRKEKAVKCQRKNLQLSYIHFLMLALLLSHNANHEGDVAILSTQTIQ